MEIKNLVSKINCVLEPMAEEISMATEITPNGIEVNTPMLVAIKATKFSLMVHSLSKEFREGGQFPTIDEKNQMFRVFQVWFNDYEMKISKMQKGSDERTCELLFLDDAKDIIEEMFNN